MRKVDLLSIVVPCHNEQEVLPETQERLHRILTDLLSRNLCRNYEIVYIDNGSTDQTRETVEKLREKYSYIRFIVLRCDFGYQGSVSAGLAYARGDVVVTIDADLQDPPEKIGEMIGHYEDGIDLVLGVREDRSSDSFVKRVFSENYYRLLRVMGVNIVHNHGDFRLMSRALVDEFNCLTERNRFIRGMVLQLDSSYRTVTYRRVARTKGYSKFSPKALFSLSFNGIVSFSYLPLHFVFLTGVFVCLISAIGIGWILYMKFSTDSVPGWASTLLPIISFGGFQLFALGLIGEYIGRLYLEVKRRPLFVVRKEYD